MRREPIHGLQHPAIEQAGLDLGLDLAGHRYKLFAQLDVGCPIGRDSLSQCRILPWRD